jgi:kynurenine formamidase
MKSLGIACVTLVLVMATAAVTAGAASFPHGAIVDLSWAYDAETIFWPTEDGFELEREHAEVTDKGYYYASNKFCTPEHGGTHIDAPLHFNAEGKSVDALPLEQLIGDAVVVDVSAAVAATRDYQVRVPDLRAWESAHGRIPRHAIVLLLTGFGKRWPDRASYLGTDERGADAVAKLHFPGLHPDAARWLVSEREVKAVGIDTASIDYGQSTSFQTHVTLFAQGVPAFENVANLDRLPARGATVIALPMKIRGGSGGPLRIVAILPS